MGLAEQLAATAPSTANPSAGCAVGKFWASLDDEDRQTFEDEVLWNDAISDPKRSAWIAGATGVKIHRQTFCEHRRGKCSCDQRGWAQP